MNRKNFTGRSCLVWLRVPYCLALLFYLILAGCSYMTLNKISRLEKKALEYGTVSVGAVRVTNYDDCYLQKSRKRLQDALGNIHNELKGGSKPADDTGDQNNANHGADKKKSNPKADQNKTSPQREQSMPKVQATGPIQVDQIGQRMAALKFVESELEDLNMNCVSPPNEPDFRRVVVSLDCSAWVRGEAGAALVYIDLYTLNADKWCHKAANILRCYLCEEKNKKGHKKTNEKLCPEEKPYPERWEDLMKCEFGKGYKSFDVCTIEPPNLKELRKNKPSDLVAYCHVRLEKKNLLPYIVHVERMGAAEYLNLTEKDYSASKFGISGAYPGLPSAELGLESRKEAQLQTAMVRPLSLAFIAGKRRAGWLFMPTKTREGKMLPTERRLRMVVDVPKNMLKLSVHVHKIFLRPDLSILPDASLTKQMRNLKKAREYLTEADDLYEKYKEQPKLYRLIKTRMRNLLYQGWAEEITVDIPGKTRDST